MSGLLLLLGMSALLGAAAFMIGMLPLSFTFSRTTLAMLSTFGTGLLLGAALGIIIPEGVEAIATANSGHEFPTKTIALSLLTGFKFMLLVERLLSRHSHDHDHSGHIPLPTSESSDQLAAASSAHPHTSRPDSAGRRGQVEFDVELGELERSEGFTPEGSSMAGSSSHSHAEELSDYSDVRKRAYPLTLGLIIHALADGLALGASARADESTFSSKLSVIVFLALIVHKAPTALALSTSLLSMSLPHSDCRKHLAVFSASTPLGALVSYGVLSLVRFDTDSSWPGIALLASGGSFLYVATVLQPGKAAAGDLGSRMRFILTVVGMLTPLGISSIFGHGH